MFPIQQDNNYPTYGEELVNDIAYASGLLLSLLERVEEDKIVTKYFKERNYDELKELKKELVTLGVTFYK